ncbi:MAG: site-specific integrase [Clostridia bacterium]|nr:site-specific integrase [Clostridia bacterium]
MAYITKHAKGYAIRFYATIDGVKDQIRLSGFKSEKEAEAAMWKYINQDHAKNENVTLEDYIKTFYRDYVENNVSASTARRYKELLFLHTIPELGAIKLCDLKPARIQKYYTDQMKEYSPTTVLHNHRVLHLAFKYAVAWQYMTSNPCEAVKAPRKAKHEIKVLTDDQVEELLKRVKNEAAYIPIYIAITTGMRLGEILGLQVNDVDIKESTFYIQHGYKRENGAMVLKSTKTHRSRRPVSMLPGTKEIIKAYRDEAEAIREEFKEIKIISNHFCIWPDGSPILPDYVGRVFKRHARSMRLDEDITFHNLRHTHATWLLKQGVHPKVVQERLGHASINTTLDLYSQFIPNLQRDIISGLNTDIFK